MIHPSLSPVANISVKGDVVSRTVGDDMILLDLESGTYYTLNSVGAVIWNELERGAARDGGLDAVAAAVVAEFEVEDETARADVSALLDDLESHGLVVVG